MNTRQCYKSEHVCLRKDHTEYLSTLDLDKLYLKNLILHQSKTILDKAKNEVNDSTNVTNKKVKKPK
jgi:hypothetical protein